MKKSIALSVLMLGSIGLCFGALAIGQSTTSQSAAKADATSDRILKTLQTRLPKVQIEKVQPSQWPWLYEVVTDNELFYVDSTGDYIFYGKVMDTKTRQDLTEQRWNDLIKADFNSLPLQLAFKQVKGDGSRKIAVFADPDCPYCVRFEKSMQEVTNVTVYTFLFPLESIHPDAMTKAKRIWCAQDRQGVWNAWMLNKKELPTATSCNTDVLKTLTDLGTRLKVSGTPTVFFQDGHRVAGAMSKEQLEEEFKAVGK